jgi:prepilin-type N-terminal cleavage/methylation domain-containing protein
MTKLLICKLNRPRGFSLLEMLIALAIGLLVGGTIITVMQSQIQLSTSQNRNMLNQADLRDSIGFITEEIVTMGSGVVEPYVEVAESEELMYVGDLNNDDVWERIHYFYDADSEELRRTLSQSTDEGASWTVIGTDVLAANISTITFAYFADNNQIPGTVDDITAVEVKMTMNVNADQTAFTGGHVGGQAMVGRMTIRNRKMD